MTQPISRETAFDLTQEAGLLNHLTFGSTTADALVRLCNLAVAHSRKAAEPVAYQYRMKPEWHDAWVKWQPCEKANFDDYVKAPVVNGWQFDARALYTHPPEADKPTDKLTGCACRWDENDNRVLTCVRHQGWLDVVEEWATTAKENQVVIYRLTSKRQKTEQNTNGTDYVSDREFDALISELQSITEEARATDYHDTLRKAALFLNLLKSKVHEYAKDIVRLDAACAEQHAAYTSAHNRLIEGAKLEAECERLRALLICTRSSVALDLRMYGQFLDRKGSAANDCDTDEYARIEKLLNDIDTIDAARAKP